MAHLSVTHWWQSGILTYTVGDDVGVTVERSLGVTVLRLVTGEVPDDQSLVARGGQEHVGAVERGCQLASEYSSHNVIRNVLSGREFVLLHGGSQAGDPAILYNQRLAWPFRNDPLRCVQSRVPKAQWPGEAAASPGGILWHRQLTWPSRVPLRISCSAMVTSAASLRKLGT